MEVECQIVLDYCRPMERENLGQMMTVVSYPCEANRLAVAVLVETPVEAEQ